MQEPKIELRSKIGRLAAAVAFTLVIGSVGVGTARADNNHRGNDRGHAGDQHRDNDNRGYRGGGTVYAARQPDDDYPAPQPNYYAAPDPYVYGNGPGYDAPPQGVTLFFGL